MTGIGLIAIIAAAQAAASAAPLQPQGKWVLEYADNMCVASRQFGPPETGVAFALRPLPLGSAVELVLVRPGGHIDAREGKAGVAIGPGGGAHEADYVMWSDKAGRRRITRVTFLDPERNLATGATITITIDKKAVTIAPAGIAQVMAAMAPCQDDLLRSWKIDPQYMQTIAIPAVPRKSEASWLTSDDYPAAVVREGTYGTTTILWMVGADGMVSGCRTVVRSGSDVLDAAACTALTKRGRYTPALDKDGKPVPSYRTRRIYWRL